MFRIARDKWNSKEVSMIPKVLQSTFLKHDKVQHFIGGIVLFFVLYPISTIWYATYGSCVLWILWEVKDALIDWEEVGFWGGDGFSYKDAISSCLGALLTGIIMEVIK